MAHYVLYELKNGDLVRISDEPFTQADITVGLAVEYFKEDRPKFGEYEWNPKFLMWRKV
jgi:hypothetical protein